MKLFKNAFLLLSVLCISDFALAEEYNYHTPSYTDDGIAIEYMDFRYNTDTDLMTVEIAANSSAGKLANGFYFTTTNGALPTSNAEVPIVYFDASNPSSPKVSVYTYNLQGNTTTNRCSNDPASWWYGATKSKYNVPDRISASTDPYSDVSQFVTKTASITTTSGVTRAVYKLQLLTKDIDAHIPFYRGATTTWRGLNFGEKIGLWGWVASSTSSAYFAVGDAKPDREVAVFGSSCPLAVGYLKSYSINGCALIDLYDWDTNTSPICNGVVVSPSQPQAGNNVNIQIKSYDPENDTLRVSYQGLPAGATASVPEGGLTNPVSGTATVNINWVPTTAQVGNHTLQVSFTQQFGMNKAHVTCPVNVTVFRPNPPTCTNINISGSQIILDTDASALNSLSKSVGKTIASLIGNKTANANLVKQADQLYHSIWNTIWSLPNPVVNCTPFQPSRCTKSIFLSSLSSASANMQNLNTTMTTLLKKLNSAIGKKCTNVNSKSCQRAKRIYKAHKKDAERVVKEFDSTISGLPSETHQCV